MNTRTLAAGTTLAATLQLMPLNAYADKVWLESDRTIVKQFAVTPSYPNKESCLLLTDNDGVIATFGFSLLQIIPLSPFSYADEAAQWSNNELIPKVVTFRVVRHGREFWIEAVEDDGSRRFLERCDSSEEANQRLEEFRIIAERIERRASSDEPHSM
jgi:hypothetical protein